MKKTTRELKKQIKGITLIALVVTIIVLLILAGVAINLTIGNNGIFTRAQNATQKWEEASKNELSTLQNLENEMDNIMNGNTGSKTLDVLSLYDDTQKMLLTMVTPSNEVNTEIQKIKENLLNNVNSMTEENLEIEIYNNIKSTLVMMYGKIVNNEQELLEALYETHLADKKYESLKEYLISEDTTGKEYIEVLKDNYTPLINSEGNIVKADIKLPDNTNTTIDLMKTDNIFAFAMAGLTQSGKYEITVYLRGTDIKASTIGYVSLEENNLEISVEDNKAYLIDKNTKEKQNFDEATIFLDGKVTNGDKYCVQMEEYKYVDLSKVYSEVTKKVPYQLIIRKELKTVYIDINN